MEKSKLLQLLNVFSAWELNNLEQFLRSPYHNRRPDVIRLLTYFRTERIKADPDFSDMAVCRTVWPGDSSRITEYPNVRSYLYELVKQYLAAEEIFGDRVLLKLRLAKAARQIKKDALFFQSIRDAHAILEKQPARNPEYLLHRFRLEYETYEHTTSHSRTIKTNLGEVGKLLDAYYFAERLKIACLQLFDPKPVKDSPDLLPEILSYLEKNQSLLEHAAIAIYFHTYLALTQGSQPECENHYRKMRELAETLDGRFSEREIRDFLLFSINFCIILSNQGKERYTSEALNLYRQGLEKGYLLKEGYLSHHTFINIVALGCTLKEFDWVKGFIKEYDNKVDPKPNLDRRDSVVLFCKARLQRDLGNYREAMQMLAQFQTDDPYYFLLAKVSLSRIYYELDEFDALESLLGTMRAYLKRNPLEERKKEHFQRQINLMYDLIKLVPADRHARARILTEIKKLPLVSDQNWFLKQIGTESSNR